jgi:hypothetical protein
MGPLESAANVIGRPARPAGGIPPAPAVTVVRPPAAGETRRMAKLAED